MNNKDKDGIYYDVVNSKKIKFIYDKGKIIRQDENPMNLFLDKKEELDFPGDISSNQKFSSKNLSNHDRYPLSFEAFNSGEYNS